MSTAAVTSHNVAVDREDMEHAVVGKAAAFRVGISDSLTRTHTRSAPASSASLSSTRSQGMFEVFAQTEDSAITGLPDCGHRRGLKSVLRIVAV